MFYMTDLYIFQFSVDYSKLPRSSGDGMEFSSSNSSDGSSSEGTEENDSLTRINKIVTAAGEWQTLPNHALSVSSGLGTTCNSHPKIINANHRSAKAQVQRKQGKEIPGVYPRLIQASQGGTDSVQLNSDVNVKPFQRQNSTNLLLQGTELPLLNSQLGLSLSTNNQLVSLAPPAVDVGFGEGLSTCKSTVVEQTAEFIDSQKVINDLEEHNSKLVEEKTKLSVQLGVQTKVGISNSYLTLIFTLGCMSAWS